MGTFSHMAMHQCTFKYERMRVCSNMHAQAVNQATLNMGQHGFNYCVISMRSSQHQRHTGACVSLIHNQVWKLQLTPGGLEQWQWVLW